MADLKFQPQGNEAECAACGTVFTSPSGHARHRPGECQNPADVGLVAIERRGQVMWRFPGTGRLPGGGS